MITEYCFSEAVGCLEAPQFQHPLLLSMQEGATGPFVAMAVPFIRTLFKVLSNDFMSKQNPSMKGFFDFEAVQRKKVDDIIKDPTSLDRSDRISIYHYLLKPQPGSGRRVPTRESLNDEAINLTFAGVGSYMQFLEGKIEMHYAERYGRKRVRPRCLLRL